MKGLETEDAYRVDQGFTARILCGCEPRKHFHRLESVRVLVPPAPVRAFIAQFVATTPSVAQQAPVAYSVVFVASSGTWRAAVVAVNDADAKAFHALPGQPTSQLNTVYARRLLNQFAAYLQTSRTTGRVPTASGRTWTGSAPSIAKEYASRGQDHAGSNGVYGHFKIPVATSAYALPVAEGELVCGAIANTVALTPRKAHVLFQDPAQHNWGLTLKPGNYPALTEYFDYEVCMIIQPNGNRDVTAYYGVMTDLTATPSPSA